MLIFKSVHSLAHSVSIFLLSWLTNSLVLIGYFLIIPFFHLLLLFLVLLFYMLLVPLVTYHTDLSSLFLIFPLSLSHSSPFLSLCSYPLFPLLSFFPPFILSLFRFSFSPSIHIPLITTQSFSIFLVQMPAQVNDYNDFSV